jgi:uncharacterized protein involved in cysteine biosynthesis
MARPFPGFGEIVIDVVFIRFSHWLLCRTPNAPAAIIFFMRMRREMEIPY